MSGMTQFFTIIGAVIVATIGLRFVDRLFPGIASPPAGLKKIF